MLKIHKGLKKKKKDKKHKKGADDDLFDEAELERYRREHQRPPLEHSENDGQNTDDPSNEGNRTNSNVTSVRDDDEWKKFQALTAGVDTILQKTQEDLDRIKSTSFFQRKIVTSTTNASVPENEDNKTESEDAEQVTRRAVQKSAVKNRPRSVKDEEYKTEDGVEKVTAASKSGKNKSFSKKAYLFVSDKEKREKESAEFDNLEEQFTDTENVSDDDSDDADNGVDDDSIFNTSYVDAATSGDLKLAYIPDSPIKELDDNYDPFDTSIADKFIILNPKKRYLNLGCAVEVLSGQIEKPTATTTAAPKYTKRRIIKPVELLLSSFDESEGSGAAKVDSTVDKGTLSNQLIESPVKTLLDEDLAFTVAQPCYPLSTTLYPPVKNADSAAAVNSLELNCVNSSLPQQSSSAEVFSKQSSVDSVEDEFVQLAAASLTKNPTTTNSVLSKSAENHRNYEPPAAETLKTAVSGELERDPFDIPATDPFVVSAAAEAHQPQTELLSKIPRPAELLAAIEDDDFDPRATSSEKANRGDNFVIDNTEREVFENESSISPKFDSVLSPIPISFDENSTLEDDFDPFDTSYVNGLPGKVELKLIEKELIKS